MVSAIHDKNWTQIFNFHLHLQLCVKTVQPKQASTQSSPSCWFCFRLDPHGLSPVTLHRASSLLLPLRPHGFTLISPVYFYTFSYSRHLDLGLKPTNSINNGHSQQSCIQHSFKMLSFKIAKQLVSRICKGVGGGGKGRKMTKYKGKEAETSLALGGKNVERYLLSLSASKSVSWVQC